MRELDRDEHASLGQVLRPTVHNVLAHVVFACPCSPHQPLILELGEQYPCPACGMHYAITKLVFRRRVAGLTPLRVEVSPFGRLDKLRLMDAAVQS